MSTVIIVAWKYLIEIRQIECVCRAFPFNNINSFLPMAAIPVASLPLC
ncbi:MAG: hypothetical protein OEW23_19520 [Candidatus Aminicenantes bacterium]|nr:hypothetical protein [Candidatus Aminicenantes bacterium]